MRMVYIIAYFDINAPITIQTIHAAIEIPVNIKPPVLNWTQQQQVLKTIFLLLQKFCALSFDELNERCFEKFFRRMTFI